MTRRMEIAKQIREARNNVGLTQEQLGEKVNQSKQTISNWERGISSPSFEFLMELQKVLNIQFVRETERNTKMQLKPLMELSSMEETSYAIRQIIDAQTIDSVYKTSIRKMMEMVLWLIVGFMRYYEEPRWKRECGGGNYLEPEWNNLSEDIEDLLDTELFGSLDLNKQAFYNKHGNPMVQRIHKMEFLIGGELFEDFDEDGYRDGYIQKVGRYGEECGIKLIKLLPTGLVENSLITELRVNLLALAEYLSNL